MAVRALGDHVLGLAAILSASKRIQPRVAPTPLTLEQRRAAVAKRLATRAARHTLGSRRAQIQGEVTLTITAAPDPAASSASPATSTVTQAAAPQTAAPQEATRKAV